MDDEGYFRVGTALGVIPAIITFFGSWWYCTATYGYLFGFGLGWLPSAILAAIVLFAIALLWGLLVAGALLLVISYLSPNSARPIANASEISSEPISPGDIANSDWGPVTVVNNDSEQAQQLSDSDSASTYPDLDREADDAFDNSAAALADE